MPLTWDEDQFAELHENLESAVQALDRIGDGIGRTECIDGPESLTEAVDRVASSMGRLAESVTRGSELLAKAIKRIGVSAHDDRS